MALIVVLIVSSLGAGYLLLIRSVSRKGTASLEISQSFYLAEAGLAEAFHAVRIGRSGQLGSETEPALYGNGLLWVDAITTPDGHVDLRSTAAVGTARSSLALVVEPTEVSLGFFSDEDMVIESVLMTDGYDSGAGSYEGQVAGDELEIDPSYPYLMIDETNGIMFYEGLFYRFVGMDGNTFTYDETMNIDQALAMAEELGTGLEFNGFVSGDGTDGYDAWATDEYHAIIDFLTSLPYQAGADEGGDPIESVLGPTTGDGGLLGSNGNVLFAAPDETVEVFGDIESGPNSSTHSGTGVVVAGDWTTRGETVDLPPVTVPEVDRAGSVSHDGLLPFLISPGCCGFASVNITADAQLVIRGPATVVIDRLTLAPGASLELDTRNGAVSLYITEALDLQPGSIVSTPGETPDELAVQVGPIPTRRNAGAPVKLQATAQFYGTIYSPGTDVYVGSDFEVFGAIAARKLTIAAGARLHFDAQGAGDSPIPRVVSWKIVETPDVMKNRGDIFRMLELNRSELLPLTESHDLAAVTIELRYLDKSGIERVYAGSEADLDWGQVAEVLNVDRDSGLGAGEDDQGQDEDGVIPTGIRPGMQTKIDARTEGGFPNGGSVFVDTVIANYLPLSAEEWSAIYDIPHELDSAEMTRLREADIAACGTGGL